MTPCPFQPSRQRRDLRRSRPYPRGGGWRRDARRHAHRGPAYPLYPAYPEYREPAPERPEAAGSGRYQLPLSPVPYRAPFDEARHPVLPPTPQRAPSPTSPRPGFLEGFREPFQVQERSSLLGSGNYVILRGGSFVDNYDYLDNHVSPYPHPSHRPDSLDNFRDFAEFAHGSEPVYSLALPERRMSTAETSTAAVSTPAGNATRQDVPETGTADQGGSQADQGGFDAEQGGSEAEQGGSHAEQDMSEEAGSVTTRTRQAANIQEILSEIANDVHADPLPASRTSHVKKRVLKDKRLTLRRQRQKEARLADQRTAEPEDPMVATF